MASPGLAPSGIVSVTLADAPAGRGSPAAPGEASGTAARDTRRYLPSGSFTRAVLLGGLDAPTGGQAQRNPQPVLLRLMDNAVLPNQFRGRIKECFVVGAGYGDVSAERAYIRTESLSCVTRDGTAIDVPIRGYVAGEDGKAGMRGRLVSKQGQILANALLTGVASGIGTAFQQSATTISVSPLGATGTVDPERQLQAGLGTGVGRALDRLARYYITLAEKIFPVIEVDAGRTVEVVLTQGIALGGVLDGAAGDPGRAHPADDPDGDAYPHLASRIPPNRRLADEDDPY
jgi:conjugal transfer pilus assembly protein TraB